MDATPPSPSSADELDLAVVICTYHRNDLLAKALASIIAQQRPDNFQVQILVCDNSDDGVAGAMVREIAQQSPVPMRWIEAHPANISVARNAAVAAVNARYIAFVDDDQEVQPGWLIAIAKAIQTLPHDAFFGSVVSKFEAPSRATPLVRQLFSRSMDAPSGFELFAMGPQKTDGLVLATCNSIFRKAALPQGHGPFDPAFGHGGGEDYDLICRMQRAGSRFGWLPEAVAHEYVPAARCEASYLRKRFFAGGQAFAAALANVSPRPGMTRWMLRAKALVQAGLLVLQLPMAALRGRQALADYSYIWAGVLGKLSLRKIYPLYRS